MKEKIIKIDAEPLEGFLIPITECKYFEGIGDCKESKGLCVANEDRYFKQLKCLQEENKELRQIRKNSPDIQEPYIYLYRQIKKQCYKLEEELKRLQQELDIKEKMCDKFMIGSGEILEKLQQENEELKEKNSHKSNLIWYIYNCSKVETIQRLLYEYYECINDDRYNEKRVKKFWDDVFHLQQRKKYKSKYKQALEKIKKWATNHNPCDIEAGINCTKEDCFKCLNYDITKITKIINEVLK